MKKICFALMLSLLSFHAFTQDDVERLIFENLSHITITHYSTGDKLFFNNRVLLETTENETIIYPANHESETAKEFIFFVNKKAHEADLSEEEIKKLFPNSGLYILNDHGMIQKVNLPHEHFFPHFSFKKTDLKNRIYHYFRKDITTLDYQEHSFHIFKFLDGNSDKAFTILINQKGESLLFPGIELFQSRFPLLNWNPFQSLLSINVNGLNLELDIAELITPLKSSINEPFIKEGNPLLTLEKLKNKSYQEIHPDQFKDEVLYKKIDSHYAKQEGQEITKTFIYQNVKTNEYFLVNGKKLIARSNKPFLANRFGYRFILAYDSVSNTLYHILSEQNVIEFKLPEKYFIPHHLGFQLTELKTPYGDYKMSLIRVLERADESKGSLFLMTQAGDLNLLSNSPYFQDNANFLDRLIYKDGVVFNNVVIFPANLENPLDICRLMMGKASPDNSITGGPTAHGNPPGDFSPPGNPPK